jgi:hypothetical protein
MGVCGCGVLPSDGTDEGKVDLGSHWSGLTAVLLRDIT